MIFKLFLSLKILEFIPFSTFGNRLIKIDLFDKFHTHF